jgi:heavy metal sensor kinase
MRDAIRLRLSQLPLRWRLTLWYLLTLTLILLLFAGFLYWQVQRSLLAQVDAGLQLAATQALVNVDDDNGQLAFENIENTPELVQRLSDDMSISLLAPDGTAWSHLGQDEEVPILAPQNGFFTVRRGDDTWRTYGEPVSVSSAPSHGWLLVTQSLEPVNETLLRLSFQLLWGLPLTLFLAGAGGFFLADRALRPIENITRTAQEISASDMSKRIYYYGPADEVGRLAATFDNMLNRLQAAFERERRFTGDAAHELRTPLTALKGRIGVTLSQPRQNTEYSATLQEMEGQVDRLIHLSNDLLFMARLDKRSRPLQLEPIALRAFLEAVIDQVASLAEAKQILLTVSIPDDLTIHGDIDLLIRLFLNLLDNAIKYTPEEGKVTVATKSEHQELVVSISDTGPGIPAEHLPLLFERFYRVEGDRSRRWREDGYGGAGLGLAIAHEIARAHEGHIAVSSTVGKGSSFLVHLPLESNKPVGGRGRG